MIAHVDLDAFFAAVEQRDQPALRGKPVVVGADPRGGLGRGVVSTCSYEARRYGIHSAMPISRAYHLCPHAVFLPVDGAKYHRVSQTVFKILEGFTPDIILFDLIMPEGDGFSFLATLKSEHLAPQAISIALTNQMDEEEKKRIMEIGASEYIVKATMIPSEVLAEVEKKISKT